GPGAGVLDGQVANRRLAADVEIAGRVAVIRAPPGQGDLVVPRDGQVDGVVTCGVVGRLDGGAEGGDAGWRGRGVGGAGHMWDGGVDGEDGGYGAVFEFLQERPRAAKGRADATGTDRHENKLRDERGG